MRITDLAHRDGKAGSNQSWQSETTPGNLTVSGYPVRRIYHYDTLMLSFEVNPTTGEYNRNLSAVYVSTGHLSVSDQGGMNSLFRELGMPLYFSRGQEDWGIWATRPNDAGYELAPWLEAA